jgi:hypothetical protein
MRRSPMRVDRVILVTMTVAALVVTQVPVEAVEETFVLKHVDARVIADALWDTGYHEDMEENLDRLAWEFANDLVRDAVRRLPYAQAYWVPGTVTRRYPPPLRGNTAAEALPRQLHRLVAVVPSENALVVSGTHKALDSFRELVAMLDVPRRQVVMTVHWVNLPGSELKSLGIRWIAIREEGMPGLAQLSANEVRALLKRADPYEHVLTASVTVQDNGPGIVAFGETMPYFTGAARTDRFDPNPGMIAQVRAVFGGTVLPVVPRINRDESVTLLVQPSVCYWTGWLDPPEKVKLSMRLYQDDWAQAAVRDGESLLVEVERGSEALPDGKFYGLASRIEPRLSYRSVLVVTPTVLEYVEPGGK